MSQRSTEHSTQHTHTTQSMFILVNVLSESNVGNASRVVRQEMNVRRQNCCVQCLRVALQNVVEIELVEIDSVDEMSERGRVERGQCRIAQFRVRLEVATRQRVQQLFRQLYDLSFARCKRVYFEILLVLILTLNGLLLNLTLYKLNN